MSMAAVLLLYCLGIRLRKALPRQGPYCWNTSSAAHALAHALAHAVASAVASAIASTITCTIAGDLHHSRRCGPRLQRRQSLTR